MGQLRMAILPPQYWHALHDLFSATRDYLHWCKRWPILSPYLSWREVWKFRRRERVRGSTFPELYLILRQHRLDIDILVAGVNFVVKNAVSETRNAALSRLSGPADGTMLEAALLGALVATFTPESVDPYPKLPSGRRMEARVTTSDSVFYVEATVLFFSNKDRRAIDAARKKGKGHFRSWHPDLGSGRLLRKIDEKIGQLADDSANVLIVSNMAMMPACDEAVRALTGILADPTRRTAQSGLGAIVYMNGYEFGQLLTNEYADKRFKLSPAIVDALEQSLRAIRPVRP